MEKQINKKQLMALFRKENENIMDMLQMFNVPDSIEDDTAYDNWLLPNSKGIKKITSSGKQAATTIDDLEERLNFIKNKMKTKKKPISERATKKREAKKLHKNKAFKNILVSAAKSIKNENNKILKISTTSKEDSRPAIAKTSFNKDGKIVFSKIDFSAHPGAKVKKSHQNPREILKRMKDTDKKINELKDQGETEKALELKNDIAWKNAFDRAEGKKVKDDPKLLYKTIKKSKVDKKKSKKEWIERKKKVEADIDQRQKKRQENINKRIKDKKTKKFKTMSKKGRIIPGF